MQISGSDADAMEYFGKLVTECCPFRLNTLLLWKHYRHTTPILLIVSWWHSR
jgi:hypothetical protein